MTTAYRAERDQDAQDPRAWDMDSPTQIIVWDAEWGYAIPEWTGDDPLHAVYQLAWEGDRTLDEAIEIVNRWDRVFHGGGRQIRQTLVTGYSQSDWWTLVHTVDADVKTFAQWLKGDVWTVTEYLQETCNLGHVHEMATDRLSEIYADSEEEAIQIYKENN